MLFVVLGPTASGKERLALALAGRLGAEIISVDSMKVYRGLDIGTAKPGAEERSRIPHHGLDVADPAERFTAARFMQVAEEAIADVRSRGRPVVLSGGTALYHMALLAGLFEGPGRDDGLRRRLEDEAAREGPAALWRRLEREDPGAAARIHPNDARRLVRALEVLELTGRPISGLQRQWDAPWQAPRHPFRMARLRWQRQALLGRIAARVDRMRGAGLLEEAKGVWERRARLSETPLQAVAYKEFFPFFEGREEEDAAWERLRRHTARLAKAQETWFKRFPAQPVDCVGPGDPALEAEDAVLRIWEGKEVES